MKTRLVSNLLLLSGLCLGLFWLELVGEGRLCLLALVSGNWTLGGYDLTLAVLADIIPVK